MSHHVSRTSLWDDRVHAWSKLCNAFGCTGGESMLIGAKRTLKMRSSASKQVRAAARCIVALPSDATSEECWAAINLALLELEP